MNQSMALDEPEAAGRAASARAGRPLMRFIAASVVVAAIVFTAGWLTGLRHAMHGALLSLAVFALLPFIIMMAGLALVVLAVMFSLLEQFARSRLI